MRTFDELLADAVAQTERLMQEDKEPAEAAFLVTEDERSLLKGQPIDGITLNLARDRFCGMKIHVGATEGSAEE
jgi:hypothetical protein